MIMSEDKILPIFSLSLLVPKKLVSKSQLLLLYHIFYYARTIKQWRPFLQNGRKNQIALLFVLGAKPRCLVITRTFPCNGEVKFVFTCNEFAASSNFFLANRMRARQFYLLSVHVER